MKAAGEVRRLFAEALAELDLGARVAHSLPASGSAAPWRVLAIGKGAPAMAAGAIARWRSAVERCLVVAPDGTDTRALVRAARRRHQRKWHIHECHHSNRYGESHL